jgi:transcriptional regulator with XRE-family HTH domain
MIVNMNTSGIHVSFGERVRTLRKKRNLTQQQLAEAVGTVQEVVSDVEKGIHVPLLSTLERFASALGVKPSSLLP